MLIFTISILSCMCLNNLNAQITINTTGTYIEDAERVDFKSTGKLVLGNVTTEEETTANNPPIYLKSNLTGKLGIQRGLHIDLVGDYDNGEKHYGIYSQAISDITGVGGYFKGANFGLQAIAIESASTTANMGIYVEAKNSIYNNFGVDIYVEADPTVTTSRAWGVMARAKGSTNLNVGFEGYAEGDASRNPFEGNCTGVTASAKYGNNNIGIIALGESQGSENYGIKATAYNAALNYAVYAYSPNWEPDSYAGHFAGKLVAVYGVITGSDVTLKKEIEPIGSVLPKLMQIEAKQYKYKKQNDNKKRYGFIAQELEQLFPDLVTEVTDVIFDENDHRELGHRQIKGINYTDIIPLLLSALQEQQQMIADNQKAISDLQKKVDDLKGK